MKALAAVWYFIRSHLTKTIGALGILTGYLLQTQSQWVTWLSDRPRGVATKWLGITVFALGVYNQLFPPKPPQST